MPDGWLRESLGDLIVLEYGKGLKEDARDGGQYPVVSSAGVVGHHSHPLVESAPVIVVGRKGSAGTVHWSDAPCWPIDTTFWVRPVTERLDPEFLYLLLQHADLPAICAQTGVPGLSRDRAYEVRVDVPPLVVQRRVVDLVDAVDTYAAAAAERAEAARDARSALLEQLLMAGGDEWIGTTLGEVADYQNGYPFKPAELGGDGLPVIRIKQLLDARETPDRASIAVPERHRIADGDLVFSWSGTLAVRIWSRGPAALNQHLFRVSERPGVERRWLALALDHAIAELNEKTHGSTMRHITKANLLPHPVLLPPLPEQVRIVDLVNAAESEAERAAQAEAAALSLRSALLGELLSGDREVPESYDELVGLVA